LFVAAHRHAVESSADSMFTLRIRPPQLAALADLSRRRLVISAVAHLRDEHPDRWADSPDPAVTTWAERRLARGQELGLVEEAALLRHLEVASRLGEKFADSPDAVGVLHDHGALQDWPATWEFLTRLHQAAVA
jgi:hypothetical protein